MKRSLCKSNGHVIPWILKNLAFQNIFRVFVNSTYKRKLVYLMATSRNDDSLWSPVLYNLVFAMYPCMYQLAFKLSWVIVLCLDLFNDIKHNPVAFVTVSLSGAVGFLSIYCVAALVVTSLIKEQPLIWNLTKSSPIQHKFLKGTHSDGQSELTTACDIFLT